MVQRPVGKLFAVVTGLAEGWRALALAFFALGSVLIFCGRPGATAETNRLVSHTAGPLIFLAIATFYAWRAGSGSPDAERRFWRKASVGYGIWTITYVLSLSTRLAGGGLDPILPYLDFGFALSFIFLVAAVEERPDDRSPIGEIGRRPSLWHATLLMSGFFSTLVLLPALYNRSQYETYLSSYGYFAAMDAVVAIRLAYFATQAESLRWRVIYGGMSFAFLLMLGVDFVTASLRRGGQPLTAGAFYDALWTLPFLAMMLSAAAGRLSLDDRRSGGREPTLSDALAASTLTWALIFPSFHFLADRFGWLDPVLARKRDLLVLLWTLLLMVLAMLRQRHLEKGLAGLVHERRDIESTLRSSEKDLRLLVERTRVADRLRAAEERFAKAFEVSPDALVLSSFEDGTLLDVNPAFEQMSLLKRADCIGRRAVDLGLWPRPERRERLIQLLKRRQQMHDLPGELRRPDGGVWAVRASYERIEGEGGDLLLAVLRDAATGEGGQLERIANLLENVRIPLRLARREPDGPDSTIFVNAGARLALRASDEDEIDLSSGEHLRLFLHSRAAEPDSRRGDVS